MFRKTSPTCIDVYALKEGDEFAFPFYERLIFCKVLKSMHKKNNEEAILVEQLSIHVKKHIATIDRKFYTKTDLIKKTHISEQSFALNDFYKLSLFLNKLFEGAV